MRKLMLFAVALIAVVGAGVAHSASPYDHLSDPVGNPAVPRCLADAQNTSAPLVCKVLPFLRPDWQAESGEWIIIRTAFGVGTQAECPSLEAIVATYTLDGKPLAVDQSPCELNSGLWLIDFRAVSPPLPSGDHSISTAFVFPAAPTQTYSTTLSVAAGGSGAVVASSLIQDSFNGTSINRNVWGWYGTNQSGNVALSQADGALTVSVSGSATNDFNAGLGTRCKAHGDFDAQLSFNLAQWPATNGVWVSLNTEGTGGFNTYRVSWHFQGGEEYGTYLPPNGTTLPATGNEGVLRLTREGSIWTGYYASELGWVQIYSGGGPTYDIAFNPSVFNSSGVLPFGGQATTVEFRKFRVAADSIVCP
jgi:hypothetical protein